LFGVFFISVLLNPLYLYSVSKIEVIGFDSEMEIQIGFASETEARAWF